MCHRGFLPTHLLLLGFVFALFPCLCTGVESDGVAPTSPRAESKTLSGKTDGTAHPEAVDEAPSEETGAGPLIDALQSVRQRPQRRSDPWHIVITKLALASALGLILAFVYRASFTGKRKKYNPSMMQSQILLCVGGALIWIIVANNIVRAFGLAGALSLIRYRTVVRDPKDTVIVFLSMLVGMACGLGQYIVAPIATAFICLLLFEIYVFGVGKKKKKKKKPEAEEPPRPPAAQD